MFSLCILMVLSAVISSHARPDGGPKSACTSLAPVHYEIKPQGDFPPYTVSVEKSGNKYTVTISSSIGEQFVGFMLQARSKDDPNKFIDGEFTTSAVSKTTDCFNGEKNTLTHINPDPKTKVVTEWTPKGSVHDKGIFRATVAKTFDVFWTNIDSPAVEISNDGAMPETGRKSDVHSMYDNCFVSKGCFGYPAGCAQQSDCEVLLTYSTLPDGIRFGMHGYLDPSMYMAMGLSEDGSMGEDSVTECILDGSTVIARESWNEGKSNTRTKELPRNQYSKSYVNGLSSCYWKLPFVSESNGHSYDLAVNNYFILLAKGDVVNGALKYHAGRLPSGGAVNFTAFEAIEGEGTSDSVKVHGTFMVTAWVGFVSFAILLARHFKNSWEDSTLGGVKIWFALHRAFMISGLLFVIVAFIVIFIHKKGWNYTTSNPHAVLGCIATALGLFNPIMAAFRPAPDHRNRPIFNWLHWAVGNSAQIIAVITIFFAVTLPASGLSTNFYWVMAVFVIVHLIFHLLFQVHTWTQSKKKSNELSMQEMNGARSYNVQNEQTRQSNGPSDNVFHLFLLSIYTMFNLSILIALYSLIAVA